MAKAKKQAGAEVDISHYDVVLAPAHHREVDPALRA